MRNVIQFLLRSYFVIIFIILEIISLVMVVQYNTFHRAAYINSANAVSSDIYTRKSNVTEYFNLKEENQKLAEENAKLRLNMAQSYYQDSRDTGVTKDTVYHQQFRYIEAKIINNSVNRRNNYITLNRGSLHGIKEDMAVISSKGVVGVVRNVSQHFSTVQSLLHKDSKVSARIKSSNYFGSLIWEGGSPVMVTLTDLPRHIKLHKGDTVETTAFSSLYPEGVPIGRIEDFELRPGDNFYTVEIRLFNEFQSLSHVYVIENLFKEEIKKVEEVQANDQ